MERVRWSIAVVIALAAALAACEARAEVSVTGSADPPPGPSAAVAPHAALAPSSHLFAGERMAAGGDPARYGGARNPSTPSYMIQTTKWYGWQTLIVDGTALAALAIGAAAESEEGIALGFGVYALGGPMVHVAHGRPAMSAASLGLRLALPLVGGVVGRGGSGGVGLSGIDDVLTGIAIGGIAAVALDASLLAHETVEEVSRFTPYVNVGVASASMGVAGTF